MNDWVQLKVTCSTCGGLRQETNHWWAVLYSEDPVVGEQQFSVRPLTPDLISNPLLHPACSQNCVSRAISAWMTSTVEGR